MKFFLTLNFILAPRNDETEGFQPLTLNHEPSTYATPLRHLEAKGKRQEARGKEEKGKEARGKRLRG